MANLTGRREATVIMTEALAIETAHGLAQAHLSLVPDACGLLMLGHGAGGGVEAPDLRAVTDVATGLGVTVARVLQPYRVSGRSAPPRAPTLDAVWLDVVHALRGRLPGLPLVVGGRSAGARVACRTAEASGAVAVLCLAFPLRPPGRPQAPSRLPELDGAGVPVLVVQGRRDPYGTPPAAPGRDVVVVDGDHSLRAGVADVRDAVRAWLPRFLRGVGGEGDPVEPGGSPS